MGKFRIRLKVQGFELEVDGDREDVPTITRAVSNQLQNLVIPGEIANGQKQLGEGSNGAAPQDEATKRKRGARRASRAGEFAAGAIEYKHDGSKYGNPVQGW